MDQIDGSSSICWNLFSPNKNTWLIPFLFVAKILEKKHSIHYATTKLGRKKNDSVSELFILFNHLFKLNS